LRGRLRLCLEQVGYSIADVTAKAVFGIMIWRIAHEKTLLMDKDVQQAQAQARYMTNQAC